MNGKKGIADSSHSGAHLWRKTHERTILLFIHVQKRFMYSDRNRIVIELCYHDNWEKRRSPFLQVENHFCFRLNIFHPFYCGAISSYWYWFCFLENMLLFRLVLLLKWNVRKRNPFTQQHRNGTFLIDIISKVFHQRIIDNKKSVQFILCNSLSGITIRRTIFHNHRLPMFWFSIFRCNVDAISPKHYWVSGCKRAQNSTASVIIPRTG